MKLKPLHLAASLFAMTIFAPTTAQAGSHYNCATDTGCQLVSEKQSTSDYTATEYPVVMAHGLGGFNRLAHILDYFHGIPQDLSKGGSTVFATKVSAVHNSEFRGEQLLTQIKTITALTGKEKVNLVGHSQGGIDIRYVAGTAPEYVASVTAISSPEQGSTTADWALEHITGGTAEDGYTPDNINLSSKAIMTVMNIIGLTMDAGSGGSLDNLYQQDGWEAANGLTSTWLAKFNAKFPAGMPTEYCVKPTDLEPNGIPYYSFTGVGHITNGLDPIDYAMALTGLTFDNDPNDGLVAACSAHLGKVLRDDYKMNHGDSINQFIGITAWGEPSPITVYRAQINRLKTEKGL